MYLRKKVVEAVETEWGEGFFQVWNMHRGEVLVI